MSYLQGKGSTLVLQGVAMPNLQPATARLFLYVSAEEYAKLETAGINTLLISYRHDTDKLVFLKDELINVPTRLYDWLEDNSHSGGYIVLVQNKRETLEGCSYEILCKIIEGVGEDGSYVRLQAISTTSKGVN